MTEVTVDVDIWCKTCGVSINELGTARSDGGIDIELCSSCLDEAKEEAKKEGYDEGYNDRDNEG